MTELRKTLNRLGLTLLFIFASILLIIQIPILNTALTQYVINFCLPSKYYISISKIQGSFPFDIKIQTVDLFDEQGQWGSLKDLEYSWRGVNLLLGNLHFDRMAVKTVVFYRFPIAENKKELSTSEFSPKIPKKLPHINVDRFYINELKFPPHLLQGNNRFSVLGELSSDYSNNHSIACFISHFISETETKDFLTFVSKIEKNKVIITAHLDDKIDYFLTYIKDKGSLDLNGNASAKIKVITDRDFSTANMSVRTHLNNLASEALTTLPFLKKELFLRLKILKTKQNSSININQLTLRSDAGVYTTGTVAYEYKTTDFRGKLKVIIPSVQQYFTSPNLTGNACLSSNFMGSFSRSQSDIKMVMDGLSFKRNLLKPLKGNLTLQWLSLEQPLGVLSLEGLQIKDPIILTTTIWANQLPFVYFKNLSFKGPGTTIEGAFHFNVDTFDYEGNLEGTIEDLSNYGDLIGQSIKGKLSIKANKQQDKSQFYALLSDFHMEELTAEFISIEGQLKHFEPDYVLIKSKNFFFNSDLVVLDHWEFQFSNLENKFSIEAQQGEKKLNLNGFLSNDKADSKTVSIEHLTLKNGKDPFLWLEKPLQFKMEQYNLSHVTGTLRSKEGRIEINNITWRGPLSGSLNIKNFPLDALLLFRKSPSLTGIIDGQLNLAGDKNNPILNMWARGGIRDISTQFDKKGVAVKVISYEIKGTQKNNLLSFEGLASSAKKLFLKGKGTLQTQGLPALTDSLKAHFNLYGDLNALNAFMLVNDRFEGQLKGDFDVEGVVKGPLLTGNISLQNGLFESSESGTLIKSLTAKAHIKESVLKLTSCSGQDFKKGKVVCAGFIDWKNLTEPFMHLEVDFKNFAILNSDDLTAKANGHLDLKTQETGHILISGDVDILKGEYVLQDHSQAPRVIKVHEDPRFLKKGHKDDYAVTYEKGIFLLNINCQLKEYFHIYGYGLKSQWNGQLLLTGNAQRSRIKGNLKLKKGELWVGNRVMNLKQGEVVFDGGKDKDPTLLIVANCKIAGYETFFRVEGKASHAAVTVESIPSLSQNQVLSLILFGKTLSNVTPAQSLQLALAMGNLKNARGYSFTDRLGEVFGVDNLSVEQSDPSLSDPDLNPGYQVRIGKQLKNSPIPVYVGLAQGLSKETGTTGILEANITDNTKVQLTVGTGERSNSLSYIWEKKY